MGICKSKNKISQQEDDPVYPCNYQKPLPPPWAPPQPPGTNPTNTQVLGKPFEDIKANYTLGQVLGKGQYGITYTCAENKTGDLYACKSILKRKLRTQSDRDDVRREVQVLQHLSGNPNIVEFKAAFEDKQSVHIVMELCLGGELYEEIIAKDHYTEREAAEICRSIVKIVHTCHCKGVMHRDLKPENFLYDRGILKVADFGLSVFIEEGKVYCDRVGSVSYVAPEVLCGCYGKEIDVWSVGVILYVLLSGKPPFEDETEEKIYHAILEGDIDYDSAPWPTISNSAKDLVRKMLTKDPRKRITTKDILEHPWLLTRRRYSGI